MRISVVCHYEGLSERTETANRIHPVHIDRSILTRHYAVSGAAREVDLCWLTNHVRPVATLLVHRRLLRPKAGVESAADALLLLHESPVCVLRSHNR